VGVVPHAFAQPSEPTHPPAPLCVPELIRAAVKHSVKESFAEAFAAGQISIPVKTVETPSLPTPSLETLKLLRKFLGNSSTSFRSPEQGVAFDLVTRCIVSALIVLPTGMGKSLLFIFAAWLILQRRGDTSFVVVFVPYKALMNDLMRRCRELGVGVMALDYEQEINPANIGVSLVLISSDQGFSETMVNFLKKARSQKRLKCMFVDECHLLFDDFRKPLRKLVVEDQIGVPLFLNSGSLTPSEQTKLLEMFRKWLSS
jgi:superfamily II DNA helicase RecQ